MRLLFLTLLIALTANLSSCGSSNSGNEIQIKDLHGIWTLVKESKDDQTINYLGDPIVSRYEFKENGYFICFDQITNKKINKSDIGAIQDHIKGQFELKENEILLNHYVGDSLITKEFEIESSSSNELVLIDSKTGKTSYFKK